MRPHEKRHAKTKQRIVQTAFKLIKQKGLEKVSLREVARQMDYSAPGIYEYFPNKAELINAVYDKGLDRLNHYFKQITPDLSAQERLIQIGLAYIQFAHEETELFFLIFSKLPSKRRQPSDPIRKDRPFGLLLDAIKKLQAEMSIQTNTNQWDAQSMAFILWSLVHGMATLEVTHLKGFQEDLGPIHRKSIEIFIKGIKERTNEN